MRGRKSESIETGLMRLVEAELDGLNAYAFLSLPI